MANKRPANEPILNEPAHKLHCGEVKSEVASSDIAAAAHDKGLMGAAKDAILTASASSQKSNNVNVALVKELNAEKVNRENIIKTSTAETEKMRALHESLQNELSVSRKGQGEALKESSTRLVKLNSQKVELKTMRTTIATLREEIATFGSKEKFQLKLIQLKNNHQVEIKRVREEFPAKLRLAMGKSDDRRESQVAELKLKHKTAVDCMKVAYKQTNKDAIKERDERAKESQKAKELQWKTEMGELRATHKQQLVKTRASVKMVEAAQKVVELNAETDDLEDIKLVVPSK